MNKKVFSILLLLLLSTALTQSLELKDFKASPGTITVPGDQPTIQDAIDVASNNDVIIVSDGKYSENIIVDGKTGLTLKSVNGAGSTIISGGLGPVITLQNGADDFTLGGTGTGFSINGSTDSTFLLQITHGESGVTIEGNIFNTTGNPSMGISIGAAGAVSLTINNNTFREAEAGDGYIWGPRISGGVAVTNNTFIGPTITPGSGYAIQFAGVTGTSNISRNRIYNMSMGVAVFNDAGVSGLTISNNIIINCTNGIRLGQYVPYGPAGDMTTVKVIGNDLSSNDIGLRINPDGANIEVDQFTVAFNNFEDSVTSGVDNDVSLTLNAENNWWNDGLGPGNEAGSSGDMVNGNVDYTPWLTSPSVVQTVSAGAETTVDARAEADVEVIIDTTVGGGSPTVTIANYSSNPGGATWFTSLGKYIDVLLYDSTGVDDVEIRLYYTDGDLTESGVDEDGLKLLWWDGVNWRECTSSGVNTASVNGYSGYVWAVITSTSTPNFNDLTGAPFGGGVVTDLYVRAMNYPKDKVLSNAVVHMTNSTNTYAETVNSTGWVRFDGIIDAEVDWWIEWQGTTVYFKSDQDMSQDVVFEAPCEVTDVEFSALDWEGEPLSDLGCQWHITVPNGTTYTYDDNEFTVSDLKNGTYYLRVKWFGSWVSSNVTWAKSVETSYDLTTTVTDVVFNATDHYEDPLDDAPCYWVIQYPNGTVQEYNGHAPTVTLGNGTYMLGVKWQGTYVVSNKSWTKAAHTSHTEVCEEVVNRVFTGKDVDGDRLWNSVTKLWLTFPNGTTYTPTSNSSSFTLNRLANGTYMAEVYFEGSKVLGPKNYSFTQAHEDVSFICSVYEFTPVVQDVRNVTYQGATFYLSCPNSTISEFTTGSNGKVTISQIQNGSYSIPNVTYNGYKVNQTGVFNIDGNLVDWVLQFNGLSVGETVYSSSVHLNSSFNVEVQLVYDYTGTPVPAGSYVGLIDTVVEEAVTDGSGWATFTLEEWQPISPYIVYGINETGYGLTYPVQNATVDITWLGDFNIQALDAAGDPLENAEMQIFNETGLWQTLSTDSDGVINVQNAPTESYTVDVYWKDSEVGSVSFDLDRSVIDRTVTCTVYSGYVTVKDLFDQPLENIRVNIYWLNEDLYETYLTEGDGSTPQIYQIPGGTYIFNLTYMDHVFAVNYDVDQDFDLLFKLGNVTVYGVPGIENLIFSTDSTVKTVTYDQLFREVNVQINGTSGSSGYFNLYVPKSFLDYYGLTIDNIHIFFDGVPPIYTVTEHTTGYLIATSYTHTDHTIEIVFSDLTLTANVKDASSNGLENAYIKVYREGYNIASGNTDDNGQLTFTNMPTGNYTIDVYQRGVLVETIEESDEFTMTSDKTYSARYHVYDLNIHVIDFLSTPLQGSAVEAFLSNGSSIVSTTADSSGTAVMRQMPSSDYSIGATYWGFTNSTTANLVQNLNVQIRIPILNILTIVLLIFTIGGGIWLLGNYFSRKGRPPTSRGRKKES